MKMARPERREMRHAVKRRKALRCRLAGVVSFCFRRAAGLLALARLLPVCPLFERFPVGVVLRLELPAAVVEGVAARLGRERHEQETARGEVAGDHQSGDRLEVAARLFLGPELGSRREFFQAESVVALRVTDVAAGVPRLLLQEDGLDPRFEKLVIGRSEEHTSELQSHLNLVCRLLLEKKKKNKKNNLRIRKKKKKKTK